MSSAVVIKSVLGCDLVTRLQSLENELTANKPEISFEIQHYYVERLSTLKNSLLWNSRNIFITIPIYKSEFDCFVTTLLLSDKFTTADIGIMSCFS